MTVIPENASDSDNGEDFDGWKPERHGTFSQGSLFSLSKNGVVRMLLRMLSACHPGNGSND